MTGPHPVAYFEVYEAASGYSQCWHNADFENTYSRMPLSYASENGHAGAAAPPRATTTSKTPTNM